MRYLVLCVALLTGCYDPALEKCTVRCRLTFDCPSGLACGEDAFCHASESEGLCPCIPLKCSDVPNSCGQLLDTCGGMNDCGACAAPLQCGVGGTPNVCADPSMGCTPLACTPNECGPSVDSCGNARTCPACGPGKKCESGHCVACTPQCVNGDLACGDDKCGGSCGTCPDARWMCHSAGACCIKSGEQCNPYLEGCNCCPGLFCVSGSCQPDTGCGGAVDDPGQVSGIYANFTPSPD